MEVVGLFQNFQLKKINENLDAIDRLLAGVASVTYWVEYTAVMDELM